MSALKNAQYLLEQDNFSKWMGISLVEVKDDFCILEMPVKEEMWNGIGTVHGGVTFAFAESVLAVSSMSKGAVSVALNCVINFTKAVKAGDVLRAESCLFFETKKTAVYDIVVKNQNGDTVAGFRGTVYRVGKPLI